MRFANTPGLRSAGAAAVLCALVGTAPAGSRSSPATLILAHGRIYTADPEAPWAEAVAVVGNEIRAVGADADVLRLRSPATRVIDLHGRLMTPGLIDSHVHFVDGGMYLKNVQLRDAVTMVEVTGRVARYAQAKPHGDWIQGEGWSYGYPDLPGGEFHKEILDAIGTNRPVFLDSGMAHAAWVNSVALRRAGITRDTPNPPGGDIVRDANGEPTGWLKEESAVRLVRERIPVATQAEIQEALLAAIHEANRLGLTRVDSAGGDFDALDTLARLRRRGALTLRVSMADWITAPGLTPEELARLEAARARYPAGLLTCCVAKFIMDGVIESHTAYLPGGYADKPAETGMRFFEPAAYRQSVLQLNDHGFQVYTHAIGDGAIKLALDAYQYAQGQAAGPRAAANAALRNRIEHAEAPDAEDIPRFGTLGVMASMQPLMIYPRDEWKGMEGLWESYAGRRFLPRAFAIRSLLASHATVAFGTDWPVVQLNPLLGMRNAVLRRSQDGQPPDGYVAAQRVSIAEALQAYTRGAAYASHADREGSIAVGNLADFAVFSENFVEGPAERIAAAHVVLTLVDGRVVYGGN